MYALLRDAVQHHLEGGKPSGSFANVHRIAEALGGHSVSLSATALHDELSRAHGLLVRPVADLAISTRTQAVVSHAWPPPSEPGTQLVTGIGQPLAMLSGREKTLDDVFGPLVDDLLQLTSGASGTATIVVHDH